MREKRSELTPSEVKREETPIRTTVSHQTQMLNHSTSIKPQTARNGHKTPPLDQLTPALTQSPLRAHQPPMEELEDHHANTELVDRNI
jgi:hypothetical protein